MEACGINEHVESAELGACQSTVQYVTGTQSDGTTNTLPVQDEKDYVQHARRRFAKYSTLVVLAALFISAGVLGVGLFSSGMDSAQTYGGGDCGTNKARRCTKINEVSFGNQTFLSEPVSPKKPLVRLIESSEPYERRDWYTEAEPDAITKDEKLLNVRVRGRNIYEVTARRDRLCSDLPMHQIIDYVISESQPLISTEGIETVVGWQGCLLILEDGNKEPYAIDIRGSKRGRRGGRKLTPAYYQLRNQIVVHSGSSGGADLYYGMRNTFRPPLVSGTGASFDYVDENRGYNEALAAARDVSILLHGEVLI